VVTWMSRKTPTVARAAPSMFRAPFVGAVLSLVGLADSARPEQPAPPPPELSIAAAATTAQVQPPAEQVGAKPPVKTQPEQAPVKPQPKIDPLELDIEQLGNVPVRPRPGAVTPTPSGATVTPSVVEAAQLSTGQLLDRAPSVSLRRVSPLSIDPRVRGYHSGQINANANGATQYRARIDIDTLFSHIDAGNIESLDVVDGPYTSIFGPGFAFLTANLRQPQRFKSPEHHGSVIFSYGYNGAPLYQRDRVWGGGPGWGYNISYGLRTGNDYRSGDPNEFRIPASYNQQDVFAALSFDVNDCSRIDLNFIRLALNNVELPGVAYDINRQTTDLFNIRWVLQEDRAGPEQAVVQFWTQRTPFTADSSRESKQATFFRTLLGFEDSFGTPRLISLFGNGSAESHGIRALRTYGGVAGPQLTIGADWRRLQQRYHETDFDENGDIAFGGNIFGIPESVQDDIGVFTHLKVPVTDDLTFTAGGRFDTVHSSLDRTDIVTRQAPREPQGFFRPGFNEPTHNLWMGYGMFQAQATECLTLSAGAAYAMRAPNLVELYNDEPYQPIARFGNSYADGNSFLDAERNFQFDVGAQLKRERFTLGARAFHSIIHNYILTIPSDFSVFVGAGFPAPSNLRRDLSAFGFNPDDPTVNPDASTHSLAYRYENLDRATLTGGEITWGLPVNRWITLDGSVAYVKGVNHSPIRYRFETDDIVPIKGAEGLPGIYPLTSTVRLSVVEPAAQKWGLELVSRMVHGQEYVADSMGELPTPGFTVFDLHGFYQVNKNLRLFSSIFNLLDRDYTEHGSLVISNPQGTALRFVPERGFTAIFGIEASF
jgi:iron complex outermembrane recepter protein